MQVKPPRPTGVTILGVLAILGGIFFLFGGIVLIGVGLVIGTYSAAQITNALQTAGYSGLASLAVATITAIVIALGAAVLMIGILSLAVGVGFFRGRGWAWKLGIIVYAVGIVLDIVQISLGAVGSILGLIIGLLIIYYLTRPHVKAFFGKGPPIATPITTPSPGMTNPSMMGSSMGSSSMGSTRCPNCGANVPTGSTKCPSCGANL